MSHFDYTQPDGLDTLIGETSLLCPSTDGRTQQFEATCLITPKPPTIIKNWEQVKGQGTFTHNISGIPGLSHVITTDGTTYFLVFTKKATNLFLAKAKNIPVIGTPLEYCSYINKYRIPKKGYSKDTPTQVHHLYSNSFVNYYAVKLENNNYLLCWV